MNLNEKTELGLSFKYVKDKLFNQMRGDILAVNTSETKKNKSVDRLASLFDDGGELGLPNTNYKIKQTAINMIAEIDIPSTFKYSFLKEMTDKKITFLLGKDVFFRIEKIGNEIYGLAASGRNKGKDVNPDEDFYVDYADFVINVEESFYQFSKYEVHQIGKSYEQLQADGDETFPVLIIQTLIFIELSDIETKILKPKEKTGTKKQGKVINNSSEDIVVVDSTCNVTSIRETGFPVKGHPRWQWYGSGKDRHQRLIWIKAFQKQGYIRKAKNEFVNS